MDLLQKIPKLQKSSIYSHWQWGNQLVWLHFCEDFNQAEPCLRVFCQAELKSWAEPRSFWRSVIYCQVLITNSWQVIKMAANFRPGHLLGGWVIAQSGHCHPNGWLKVWGIISSRLWTETSILFFLFHPVFLTCAIEEFLHRGKKQQKIAKL